jgi:iron complex outermembrane recepter protein
MICYRLAARYNLTMRLQNTLLLSFLFCALFSNGFSQDTIRISGKDSIRPFSFSEIEVVAFQTPGKLKAAGGAVSVVSIGNEQNGDVNILPALSNVPGLFIEEGTSSTVKLTLRGIGSRYPYGTKKIKLFFDDIPLYSAEGETIFDDISPEFLSKMEILRGPASGIYGASLGGAILLFPRKSVFRQSEINFYSTLGSFGYENHSLNYSKGDGRNDLFASYSVIQSNGFRQNNHYDRNSFFIHYKRLINKKLTGSLLISGSMIKSQIPSSVDSLTLVNNPSNAAPNWYKTNGYEHPQRILGGYKMTYSPSQNWDFLASVFATYRKTEENRPFNFLKESGESYGSRMMGVFVKKISGYQYRWVSGTNLFFEGYQNSLFENIDGLGKMGALQQKGRETIYQSDFFTQGEIQGQKITFGAGVNLNSSGFRFIDQFSTDSINQSGSYHFQPIVSPRISIVWSPVSNIHIYSAINHGFSVPSLSETLSPLGLINRDIKPEKALSFEGGIRLGLFGNRTFLDISSYYMMVSDLIVPKRVSEDIYVGMNAGSSLHKGVEITLKQNLWGKFEDKGNVGFSATTFLAYSLNSYRFRNFGQDNIDYSGKKIPGMPDQNFSARIDTKTNGFFTSFGVIFSGKIPLTDVNDKYSNPFLVMNAKAGFEYFFNRIWLLNAMISINNIANERYASMVVVNAPGTLTKPPRFYYPGMPRWISFTLLISYRKRTGE